MSQHRHRSANAHTLDSVGATASIVCAVHCALVAVLLGVVPAISAFAASWIDWLFLGISSVVGLASLIPGYRMHRMRLPLALFAVGIALLLALRVLNVRASIGETAVVLIAASSLVAAHWLNRGAASRCICGQRHD